MEIRRAGKGDIDALTENRVTFGVNTANVKDPEAFLKVTRQYIETHIESDELIAYLAIEDGQIKAVCLMSVYQTIPIPSCLNGKCGLLLNVWTHPEYRRQGLATRVLKQLVQKAKELNVGKILLAYTDDGHPLYQAFGFQELDRQMVLKLE